MTHFKNVIFKYLTDDLQEHFHLACINSLYPGGFVCNLKLVIFKPIRHIILGYCYPASIATLAQRWPNVNPYVGPTSAHQRWANVDLSIGPTLAQRLHANVGPRLCQHRPNVGTLTLGQRWYNGGCVTGFLWGEPIGHRSVTGWTNSRVE